MSRDDPRPHIINAVGISSLGGDVYIERGLKMSEKTLDEELHEVAQQLQNAASDKTMSARQKNELVDRSIHLTIKKMNSRRA